MSYFPPPVRAVEIPKPHGGGVRVLGVPTVADRVAQTVVATVLEEAAEPRFHHDSYGYRPGKAAWDAIGTTRKRCWSFDWAIDLDVQRFFDTVPWDLVQKGNGTIFSRFLPAAVALKAKSADLRRMRIHRRTTLTLKDLARWLNPIVAGWMNYYGRFYRSALEPLLRLLTPTCRPIENWVPSGSLIRAVRFSSPASGPRTSPLLRGLANTLLWDRRSPPAHR